MDRPDGKQHAEPRKQRARFTWNFQTDIFASRDKWMQKHCVWCWSSCWDDRAGGGDAHLDRSGRDGHAARIRGLSGMVQTALAENPFSGQVFVFRGKRGDLIKLLWWDGDGLCLFAKRLERGKFIWPQATNGTVSLTPAQLPMLLEGIDWRRPARSYAPQMAV
jgi:transposase